MCDRNQIVVHKSVMQKNLEVTMLVENKTKSANYLRIIALLKHLLANALLSFAFSKSEFDANKKMLFFSPVVDADL
ncbi:hypothetical protein SDC9_184289 [bioreactor metagenome]|uniref:Uncharacterized protein n=1 Tax=bioreactor metagenome TaxID=1076179 RepID=A0A645HCM0_9ZZZZ